MSLERTRAVELLTAGWSTQAVAEVVERSQATVKRWKREAGLTRAYRRNPPPVRRTPHLGRKVTTEQCAELWKKGLNKVEIAAKLLIDRKTVARRLKAAGLGDRPSDDEVFDLWAAGLSNTEIGRRLGLHRRTVGTRVANMGLMPNGNGRHD